jgi:signal transduction histidine kinase
MSVSSLAQQDDGSDQLSSFDPSHILPDYPLTNVASLVVPRTAVKPENTVDKVSKLFLSHPDLHSVPVVHKGTPIGMVHRYQLMDIYLTAYGRDLHGRKSILKFMDTNPIIIEDELSLEAASRYITKNMQYALSQDFIITHHGKYRGVGLVMDLLRRITDLQIEAYNQALAQKVEELEKRTSELLIATMQAQAANERAQAAYQVKNRFLANMSHELRTPINAILGYSEIIQEEAEELKQDFCLSDLSKIQKAGRHLLALLSDILEATKLAAEQVELNLNEFNFAPVLYEMANSVMNSGAERYNQFSISCEYNGKMYADEAKLRHCLYNLLINANKFTYNGKITLSAKQENQWIVISVQDTGIGMSSQQLANLFVFFAQSDDSATRKYDGSGLGLAIVKQFCDLMEGHIEVESEVNQGSKFTLYLPLSVTQVQ